MGWLVVACMKQRGRALRGKGVSFPGISPLFRFAFCSMMKARNPGLEVVCELISRPSISFLSNENGDEYDTQVFAAGHVFTPAMLDILLCQAFFAPHVRARALVSPRPPPRPCCIRWCTVLHAPGLRVTCGREQRDLAAGCYWR
jgi:hypothetical protein